MTLGAGESIGPYRIERVLGEGGMAVVYEAVHELIGRRAAIKVLHEELAAEPAVAARFVNEARAANLVRHPGLVEIFEIAADGGRKYIVMELVQGELLSELARRSERRLAEVLAIGRKLAEALAAAHDHGIVHRDLKPENVMIAGDQPKVLDFGVAKVAGPVPSGWGRDARTRTGATIGTPAYMSPEQCEGAGVDARSDVYSLGVVLYELLSGRRPFEDESSVGVMWKQIHSPPPRLQDLAPSVPAPVAALVARMLAKHPAERPEMSAVASALAELEATAGDVRVAARAARQAIATEVTPAEVESRPRPGARWVAVAAAVLLGAAAYELQPRAEEARGPEPVAARPMSFKASRLVRPATRAGELASGAGVVPLRAARPARRLAPVVPDAPVPAAPEPVAKPIRFKDK